MTSGRRVGLVGHNIAYSRSPEIFRAIFDIDGVDGSFDTFDIAPADFETGLPELLASGVEGLSVTIPYKQEVVRYLDDVDAVARTLQAVNSISVENGFACGFNTDVYGFSLPLQPHAEYLKKGSALIIGCGGAARAAVYSLYTDFELSSFIILGRTKVRLEQLRRTLRSQIDGLNITVLRLADFNPADFENPRIMVNATPLGGANHAAESPLPKGFTWPSRGIYYDLNYNRDNRLVESSAEVGMTAIGGAAMLVGQALRSYQLWTGRTVAFQPVFDAVFKG